MGQNVDMVTNPAVESSSQLLNFTFSSAKKNYEGNLQCLGDSCKGLHAFH
jgi:hypothetical protein